MYTTALQTIPGRDAKTNVTIDRVAWLKRYLVECAQFCWTETYKARANELGRLTQNPSALPDGCRIAADNEPGWFYRTAAGMLWITDAA